MLDAGAQVIVIDPVGNWFGLRIAADGRSKGKDIFVIGGEHGDLPMVPDAGAKIARLLVEKRISAVLDISGFRQGERKRFAAEFAEEFFHLKKSQRSAVHLFIEEAQLFAPQRCGPDEARMLGAFENIVRLGRNYGIVATMVTQRPQSVNKEVLSQVECLCVLQVNGTHERKALEEWVQEAGADRKLVGELPGLSRGEGYVWSPSWLKVFRKVKFNSKTTFDASATPEVGKAAKAAKLSDVDVAKLRESLQEVVAKAEQDDPKALRKKIVELEREVAKKPATNVTKVEEKIIEIKVPVIDQAMVLDIRDCVNVFGGAVSGIQKEFGRLIAKFEDVIAEVQKQRTNIPKTIPSKISDLGAPRLVPRPVSAPKPINVRSSQPGVHLPPGEKATLTACAQYPDGCDRTQLSVLTGYKRSSRDAYIQRLREKGFVEVRGELVLATQDGIDALGSDYEPLPTGEELQKYWLQRLPDGERAVLDLLICAGGGSIPRETIDENTGYKRSSRDAYIQRLMAKKFVENVGRGEVKASALLFD
jgi:hypothetical protein